MKTLAILVGLATSALVGAASAATIDFSENNGLPLVHGSFVDGAFDFGNGLTGTISTTSRTGTAQVFDTSIDPAIATQDPDLQHPRETGTGIPNASLGNALIINEGRNRVDDDMNGGVITFFFDKMVKFTGVTLIDLEFDQPLTILAEGFSSGPLYDADNFYSVFTADAPVKTNYLTFQFVGSGAIDNIQVAAVPLPASLMLLLGGLGAFAAVGRRKKA